jgi:hypothetical protein
MEQELGRYIMKKRYFTIVFLVFILMAVALTSDPSMKVVNKILVLNHEEDKDKIVIVIDPGHPNA